MDPPPDWLCSGLGHQRYEFDCALATVRCTICRKSRPVHAFRTTWMCSSCEPRYPALQVFKEVLPLPHHCQRSPAADGERLMQLNRLPRSLVAVIGSSPIPYVFAPEELPEPYQEQCSGSNEEQLDSPMTISKTETPSPPHPNFWNSPGPSESSVLTHPTCQEYCESKSERWEISPATRYCTPGETGGSHGKPPFEGQKNAQPELLPDAPSTPGTLPHQTELSSLEELLPLGFTDELVEEMIKYSGGRYICRLCEAWEVPGTAITTTGLFVARVHVVKMCHASSAELKTRLLELELDIDGIPGQHDTSYLAYLNDFTLGRVQLPNSLVIPSSGV